MVTEFGDRGHSISENTLSRPPVAKPGEKGEPSTEDLAKIYAEHAAFVWRSLRRMGVPDAVVDDATQDVFLVAHRRLADFDARSQIKTWLFGIVLRVGSNYRRSGSRKAALAAGAATVDASTIGSDGVLGPVEFVEKREAVTLLYELLGELEDDKRAVLVCVELEQMTVGEAAEALGIKVATAYSRLRAAHRAFEQAVARRKARNARLDRKLAT